MPIVRGLIQIKPFGPVRPNFSGMSVPGSRSPAPPILSAPLTMPLQFHHAVEKIEIWSATTGGYSFVISFESPAGTGFHGRFGYVASWRAAHHSRGAVKIDGSPFATFEEAEAACNVMLEHLTAEN